MRMLCSTRRSLALLGALMFLLGLSACSQSHTLTGYWVHNYSAYQKTGLFPEDMSAEDAGFKRDTLHFSKDHQVYEYTYGDSVAQRTFIGVWTLVDGDILQIDRIDWLASYSKVIKHKRRRLTLMPYKGLNIFGGRMYLRRVRSKR